MILTCYCRPTYYHGATVSEYRERHQEFHAADVERTSAAAEDQPTAAGLPSRDWLSQTDGRVHGGGAKDQIPTGGVSLNT